MTVNISYCKPLSVTCGAVIPTVMLELVTINTYCVSKYHQITIGHIQWNKWDASKLKCGFSLLF